MLNFITGPLFVFSLLVFVVGLLVRAVLYVRGLDWRLERVAYGYHPERSIPGALVSIVKWLIRLALATGGHGVLLSAASGCGAGAAFSVGTHGLA